MIILQIFIGLFAAVGIGCILADLMKVPTMKASKAANNLGKKGDKKTSIIEIYLKELATKLSEKIKLNEYKKAQLEADLRKCDRSSVIRDDAEGDRKGLPNRKEAPQDADAERRKQSYRLRYRRCA